MKPRPARWQHWTAGLALLLGAATIGANTRPQADSDNLPPQGRALFDRYAEATDGGRASRAPYPLQRLLERIRRDLDPDGRGGGLSTVLIPLGRSLQRHAAEPGQYFRYPRAVIAVTGGPPAAASPATPYLKDRLYLGFHEKAETLEIISYNPTAGRFEFQVADDYRPGGSARLRYANRALCLACHQNAAPIFSRQSWDESSANPRIAAALGAAADDFYRLAWRAGVDIPNAIDQATSRANLLPLATALWQQACGAREAGRNCRGQLLRLALRQRLAGGVAPSLELPGVQAELVGPLLEQWQKHWPDGIPVGNPELPNRQPFAGLAPDAPTPTGAALEQAADISAAFDPLALRPPLEIWPVAASTISRLVAVLADGFSPADAARLDAALPASTANNAVLALDCHPLRREARVDLSCTGQGTTLSARLTVRGGGLAGGTIDRIAFADGTLLHGLPLIATAGSAPTLSIDGDRRDSFGARPVRLDVDADFGHARLGLRDELVALDEAVGRIDKTLLDRPPQREVLLPALLAALGQPVAPVAIATSYPPPYSEPPPAPAEARVSEALRPFVRRCSLCHASKERFPPPFMAGDEAAISARLGGCAERIAYRLAMWSVPAAARTKTPMPPAAVLPDARFAESADLAAMRRHVSDILAARPAPLSPERLLAREYAGLPPCRPVPPASGALR